MNAAWNVPWELPSRDRFFTADTAGMTASAVRWAEKQGQCVRVVANAYRWRAEPITPVERTMAVVVASAGAASGYLAARLLDVDIWPPPAVAADVTVSPDTGKRLPARVRRRWLAPQDVVQVNGFDCTSPVQTVIDLAADVTDEQCEQNVEWLLRQRTITADELRATVDEAGLSRVKGVTRLRGVLDRRPPGVPPTGSLLETLFLQLTRRADRVPEPQRQVVVENAAGRFVAQVDFAWRDLGVFIELDGMSYHGQPVYDATRETAVVAATGWLCGRFTWREVTRTPTHTARVLAGVIGQGRRRNRV